LAYLRIKAPRGRSRVLGGPPRAEDGPHPAPTWRQRIETTARKISLTGVR
jgi:hypothetical protein